MKQIKKEIEYYSHQTIFLISLTLFLILLIYQIPKMFNSQGIYFGARIFYIFVATVAFYIVIQPFRVKLRMVKEIRKLSWSKANTKNVPKNLLVLVKKYIIKRELRRFQPDAQIALRGLKDYSNDIQFTQEVKEEVVKVINKNPGYRKFLIKAILFKSKPATQKKDLELVNQFLNNSSQKEVFHYLFAYMTELYREGHFFWSKLDNSLKNHLAANKKDFAKIKEYSHFLIKESKTRKLLESW